MKEQNILDVEKEALAFLLEARKASGMSETEFGQKAFPELANPRTKINSVFQGKNTGGKALRLRLGDFCAMCLALGKNPAQELLLIWNKISQE